MRFRTAVVVDDEAGSRAVIRHVLELSGLEVVVAEDGDSGLALIREASPDLVVTDIRMPGPSGVEMVRQLRQDPGEQPVVVAVTSHPQDVQADGLFALVMRKPVSAARLLEWLDVA